MDKHIVVNGNDTEYINVIYSILRKCGINMAFKGLFHWIPFYSKRAIKKDCENKVVILVWNEELNDYTSTFQMYKTNEGNLYIRKIATLPQYEGKGIGKRNLLYMEQYAVKNECPKILRDVYNKSKRAIAFYLHFGFQVIGIKHSIRFKELIMEKLIS